MVMIWGLGFHVRKCVDMMPCRKARSIMQERDTLYTTVDLASASCLWLLEYLITYQ